MHVYLKFLVYLAAGYAVQIGVRLPCVLASANVAFIASSPWVESWHIPNVVTMKQLHTTM